MNKIDVIASEARQSMSPLPDEDDEISLLDLLLGNLATALPS